MRNVRLFASDATAKDFEPSVKMKLPLMLAQCNPVMGLQYVKYCIVGGSGVVVDMLVLHLLAFPAWLGWNLTLSKVIAAEVAMFNNFLWNDEWTFHAKGNGQGKWRPRLIRLAKFNLICTAGIALSVGLLNLQAHCFGMNVYLVNFVSIVVVSFWNFFLNRRFGWGTSSASQCAEGTGRVHP